MDGASGKSLLSWQKSNSWSTGPLMIYNYRWPCTPDTQESQHRCQPLNSSICYKFSESLLVISFSPSDSKGSLGENWQKDWLAPDFTIFKLLTKVNNGVKAQKYMQDKNVTVLNILKIKIMLRRAETACYCKKRMTKFRDVRNLYGWDFNEIVMKCC